MARIEFVAGLYMNEDGPVIPARLLEAAVVEGARKSKLGKHVQAGVIVEKHATLIYDGPRTAKELFEVGISSGCAGARRPGKGGADSAIFRELVGSH